MDFAEIIAVLAALTGDPVDPEQHFGAVATGGHDASAPVAIKACPQPIGIGEIEGETLICGTVSVPEDHDAPEGRRLELLFTVMKSHSEVPEPDPLLYLHGGPGMGNMNGIAGLAQYFDGWRQTRDVITFDQRAAGLSTGDAACSGVINENIRSVLTLSAGQAEVSACVAELRNSGITLQHYNTLQNARDVPIVIGTLGYDNYNIIGISYGSKLALEVMRSAPEGVRSVVLDGVAPPWLPLYNTLAVPMNDSIVRLVEDCAADKDCASAYPDLGQMLTDTLDAAAEGRLVHGASGTVLGPEVVLDMFAQRADGSRIGNPSITPFMPAMIYEFARMVEDPDVATPTLDRLSNGGWVLPRDRVADLRGAAQVTSGESETLLELAIAQAERVRDTDQELQTTIRALRDALRRERDYTPLAGILDGELSRASGANFADRERVAAFANDVAALISGQRARAPLVGFIAETYEGPTAARLLALVDAMSDAEIASFFESAARSLETTVFKFVTTTDLWIYACQEDVPFNSMEGYQATTAALDYPQLGAIWTSNAGLLLLGVCPMFDQFPRERFQEVVESDIPTLSLGGTWDTQTSFNWAIEATRGLSNAQAFAFPEAGHGAVLYSKCVRDMAVSFTGNPNRRFDPETCQTGVIPPFHIAEWVDQAGSDE
ncbi:alpha/beta hydrolase [Roseibaca sp. Y0-43]|uniref:alpha/beta hydrolase n=1 Tax=Roseibaca sp. Y0-43 TaxID=2816854 RepID=UPI001D0C971D|nr:alpha/beta hydrolase [Roseibaca sp. Y0-43]MCC1480781.1 alpha/beta hydrolase [Roseibaca sp. Y0-43]